LHGEGEKMKTFRSGKRVFLRTDEGKRVKPSESSCIIGMMIGLTFWSPKLLI